MDTEQQVRGGRGFTACVLIMLHQSNNSFAKAKRPTIKLPLRYINRSFNLEFYQR